MIDTAERAPWSRIDKDEWLQLRPYILDCEDLPSAACKQVRQEFQTAGAEGIVALARVLNRPPTQEETDRLRAVITAHFNSVRIRQIALEHGNG